MQRVRSRKLFAPRGAWGAVVGTLHRYGPRAARLVVMGLAFELPGAPQLHRLIAVELEVGELAVFRLTLRRRRRVKLWHLEKLGEVQRLDAVAESPLEQRQALEVLREAKAAITRKPSSPAAGAPSPKPEDARKPPTRRVVH